LTKKGKTFGLGVVVKGGFPFQKDLKVPKLHGWFGLRQVQMEVKHSMSNDRVRRNAGKSWGGAEKERGERNKTS
jgi:hypothetical protein